MEYKNKKLLGTAALMGATFAGATVMGSIDASADQIHTVQAGETLSQISQDTTGDHENYQKIAEDNGIQNADFIVVGQQINIKDDYSQNVDNQDQQTQPVEQSYQPETVQKDSIDTPVQNTQSGWTGVDYSSGSQSDQGSYSQSVSSQTSYGQGQSDQIASGGSVYDQFIAAGGTPEMWTSIVMPESGGNPNAVSPNGYHGLGQTKESWGYGSVAEQTAGMINYGVQRYGSIQNAIQFRQSRGWW